MPPDKLNEAFEFDPSFENALKEYYEAFGSDLYIAASRRYLGHDSKYLYQLSQLSKKLRDVGKAMGLSVDAINRLSSSIWEFTDEWFEGKRIAEQGFNPADKHLQKVLQLTKEFMGFPPQLGQHTGGFVITRGKLSYLCPILNARMKDRTCIEWNKEILMHWPL